MALTASGGVPGATAPNTPNIKYMTREQQNAAKALKAEQQRLAQIRAAQAKAKAKTTTAKAKVRSKPKAKVHTPKPKTTRAVKAASHTAPKAHKPFSGKHFLKTHEERLIAGFQKGYGITATGKIDKATKAHLAKVVAGHKGDPNYARAAALLALANGNKAKAAKILRNRHVRDQRIKHGKRVKGRLNEASRKQEKAAGASWGPFDKQHSHHGWAGGNDPASNGKSGKKAGAKAQKGGKK